MERSGVFTWTAPSDVVPAGRDLGAARGRGRRRDSASTSARASSTVAAWPSRKTTSRASARRELDRSSAAPRTDRGPPRPGPDEPVAPLEQRRMIRRAVPAQELRPVAGPRTSGGLPGRRRRRARRSRRSTGCAPGAPPSAASTSVTMNGALASRATPSTHSTYAVTERRRGLPDRFSSVSREIFTGSSERHELQEVEGDAVGGVLEAAVALPVPGDVRSRRPRGSAARSVPRARRSPRRARRASRPAGRSTGSLDQGVSWFSRLLHRPRVPGAGLRDLEPELGIGDDVDPGGRRPLPLAQDGHVLAAVVGKAAEPVEELELGAPRRGVGGAAPVSPSGGVEERTALARQGAHARAARPACRGGSGGRPGRPSAAARALPRRGDRAAG